jgi:hypothetical protein
VNELSARIYFKKFVSNYTSKFYDDYIKWPHGKMLQDVMETFRKLGLPGCFGSVDCTRVH